MTAISTVHRFSRLTVPAGILWVLSYLGALFALKDLTLEPWLRLAVALTPLLPTALFLAAVVSAIRSFDELERRVHLEALAVAFPLAVLLLMTLGLLELAVALPAEDWSYRHVWIYLPIFYFAGLAVARRR